MTSGKKPNTSTKATCFNRRPPNGTAGSLDWSTARYADAYDLTIDDIHTDFVGTGEPRSAAS